MITIIQQPQASGLQAAYRPIRYTLNQSGVNTVIPPAVEVSAKNGSAVMITFPAGIDLLSNDVFTYFLDMSGIAAAYIDKLSGLPLPFTTVTRVLPGSLITLSVSIAEFAAGTNGLLLSTGTTITSNTCYVIDAYRRAEDSSQSVASYGIYATPRLLTRRPQAVSMPITAYDSMTCFNAPVSGSVSGNASLAMIYTFYDQDGEQIGIASLTVSAAGAELVQFPTGPADLSSITFTEGTMPAIAGVSYYTIATARRPAGIPDGEITFTPTGDQRTIYISRAPCDPLVVHFYNSFGAWETVRFDESATYQQSLSGQSYQRPNAILTIERSSRWSVQVASSSMTREEAVYLLDLANSPVIYVQQGTRMIPVELDASVLPLGYGPGADGRQPFNVILRASSTTQSQRAY